jgi:hypothetical protein
MLPSGAKAPLIFLDLDVRAKARTLQNLSGEAILMDWLKPVPFKTCLVKRS